MRFVLGPLHDPAFQYLALCIGDLPIRLERWHDRFRVRTSDANPQFTFLRMTRHDSPRSISLFSGCLTLIEAEICLPSPLIETMTGITMLRQNRKNITIESDLIVGIDGYRRECRN